MKFIKGNLLNAQTQALVNTVNTVGVMGKGIALQFKEAFPYNFRVYQDACRNGELQPGKLLVVKESNLNGERLIINFPTKTQWHLKSKYEYIESGLRELVKIIDEYKIKSIAIPPLGCGNGGLKWEKVKPIMEKYLSDIKDVDVIVFEPNDKVKEILKNQEIEKDAKLTHARAMLLYSMFYFESLGESSSLFVANKLAYFLQRLGENSLKKLTFVANHYGPYSVGVEHMLHNVNGKYIRGLEQMNAKPFEPLELQYDRVKEVSEYIKNELSADQRTRLKNLLDLIKGYQSAISLEVLASVDFVRKDNPGLQLNEVINTIHKWSDRKHDLFQPKHVGIALAHLQSYSQRTPLFNQ